MFERVLVPMSGSPRAERILHPVADIARWCESELTLFHVMHSGRSRPAPAGDVEYPDMLVDRAESLVREYFGELVTQLGNAGIRARGTMATGEVIDSVISRAFTGGFDLMAFVADGRAPVARRFAESAGERIRVRSPIPMLILNARLAERQGPDVSGLERLLVPLDGGRVSELGLAYARRLARAGGLGITLLRVVPDVPDFHIAADAGRRAPQLSAEAARAAEEYLERHATALAEAGFDVATVVVEGRVGHELAAAQAARPDHLLLISSTLRQGWQRAVAGCTVDEIVRCSPLPLLVIPAGKRPRRLLAGARATGAGNGRGAGGRTANGAANSRRGLRSG